MRRTTRLGAISLIDTDGTTVRLGTLWHDQPVVLAFIRHFG